MTNKLKLAHQPFGRGVEWWNHLGDNLNSNRATKAGLIGGFGGGKTFLLALASVLLSRMNAPYVPEEDIGMLFTMKTGGQIRKAGIPTFRKVLSGIKQLNPGFSFTFKGENSNSPVIVLPWGRIGLASRYNTAGNESSSLEGGNLYAVVNDELTLDTTEIAHSVSLSSRVRLEGCKLAILWGGRPYEGNWVRDKLCEGENPDYHVILKTGDNPFNAPGYVDDLRSSLPPHLVEALINGEWSDFVEGQCFVCFKDANIRNNIAFNKTKDVYWSHDFNVDGNHSTLWHLYNNQGIDELACFDEIVIGNVPLHEVVREFYLRYPPIDVHGDIIVLGDPAGNARNQVSNRSNYYTILHELERLYPEKDIILRAPAAPIPVRDSIQTANALLLNAQGLNRMFFNTKCKATIKSMRSTKRTKGGGILKDGTEHASDTVRYFAYTVKKLKRWPE